jgi:NADH:ubiquinone oxidoreductase subunit 5 (subunit L)/multisubunit Na+/H+ antiporter MnhA subunit
MLALATLSVPILGSFLTLIADRAAAWLRNLMAVLVVTATFILCLSLIPGAPFSKTTALGTLLIPGMDLSLIVDGLGVFVATMASFIGLLIVFYSFGYMKEYSHQGEYYFLIVLFLGAMMGLVLSNNLLMMYVFWETTALCSWRLIGFFRVPEHLRNADTALMMTVFGSFFMLIGMEMIWHDAGTLTITALKGKPVSDLSLFFFFLGILTKSAQVPLQVWLPAAGVAPSPVTALLHAAVLVIIGVFAFARVFVGAFGLPQGWQTPTFIVAISTIFIASGAALVENNAKRVLAYSTLGQLGYVYLGLASGTPMGLAGGLAFLLAHSIAKAGLFLCVGIVEKSAHTRDLREMGGLLKRMPLTAIAFAICALTIAGIPPTAGFTGKLLIVLGLLQAHAGPYAALAAFGGFLTLAYMLRIFNGIFLGAERQPEIKEGTGIMLATVLIFAILSLVIGLAASRLMNPVNAIAAQLLR